MRGQPHEHLTGARLELPLQQLVDTRGADVDRRDRAAALGQRYYVPVHRVCRHGCADDERRVARVHKGRGGAVCGFGHRAAKEGDGRFEGAAAEVAWRHAEGGASVGELHVAVWPPHWNLLVALHAEETVRCAWAGWHSEVARGHSERGAGVGVLHVAVWPPHWNLLVALHAEETVRCAWAGWHSEVARGHSERGAGVGVLDVAVWPPHWNLLVALHADGALLMKTTNKYAAGM